MNYSLNDLVWQCLTSDLNDESADQEKEAADTFEDRIILVFELPKFDSSE